ncbi:hypothetical protein [Exiguobacterium sp. s28]|uniref:hypothetical protein n=1 Tax=Exiguobacterium sp. s28 TaxID=2751238 RepID=UPI001BE94F86|nr:hypothetical protein [Exiguobacterium sp. s28]
MIIAYAFENGIKEENVFRDRLNLQLNFERHEVLAERSSTLFVEDTDSKRHHKIYLTVRLKLVTNESEEFGTYGEERHEIRVMSKKEGDEKEHASSYSFKTPDKFDKIALSTLMGMVLQKEALSLVDAHEWIEQSPFAHHGPSINEILMERSHPIDRIKLARFKYDHRFYRTDEWSTRFKPTNFPVLDPFFTWKGKNVFVQINTFLEKLEKASDVTAHIIHHEIMPTHVDVYYATRQDNGALYHDAVFHHFQNLIQRFHNNQNDVNLVWSVIEYTLTAVKGNPFGHTIEEAHKCLDLLKTLFVVTDRAQAFYDIDGDIFLYSYSQENRTNVSLGEFDPSGDLYPLTREEALYSHVYKIMNDAAYVLSAPRRFK